MGGVGRKEERRHRRGEDGREMTEESRCRRGGEEM